MLTVPFGLRYTIVSDSLPVFGGRDKGRSRVDTIQLRVVFAAGCAVVAAHFAPPFAALIFAVAVVAPVTTT